MSRASDRADTAANSATFPVAGMTCAACALNVERALRTVPGVANAEVSFGSREATVTYAGAALARARLQQALAGSGYSIPDDSGDKDGAARAAAAFARDAERDAENRTRRALLVALSFGVPALALEWLHVTAWIPLLASTVVVAWAGADVLASGARALLHRAPDMNSLVALGAVAALIAGVLGVAGPSEFHGAAHHAHAAALILIFALLGRWLETRARTRTGDALQALVELAPPTVRVLRRGAEVDVPNADVRVGMLALVRPGERIPVDGTLLEGASEIDESTLTGEGRPRDVAPGDLVYAGTLNGAGALSISIQRVGDETALARIARIVQAARGSRVPIQRLVDRVSAVFVPLVLLAAVATFAAWSAIAHDWIAAADRAIALLVVACPCALGLATPAAIVAATGAAARMGVLVRDAAVLEQLASIDTLVLDKTGTLTSGRPRLVAVHATDAARTESVDDDELLRWAAAVETASEQPLGRAIVRAAELRGLAHARALDFRAEPGNGVRGNLNGREVWLGSPRGAVARARGDTRELTDLADAIARRGASPVVLQRDGRAFAVLELRDELRAEAPRVVRALASRGIDVRIASGDHDGAVAAVATELSIEHAHAGATPERKAELLRALRTEGRRVCMVGDGVNDAPALAVADVGIAIGGGADVALETADGVLLRADLELLPRLVDLARRMRSTIRANLAWAFAYNALALPLAAGAFAPWTAWSPTPGLAAAGMATSSLIVVLNSVRLLRAPRVERA